MLTYYRQVNIISSDGQGNNFSKTEQLDKQYSGNGSISHSMRSLITPTGVVTVQFLFRE